MVEGVGVSDEQLDEWEAWSKDTDLADAFNWQYHCERVIGEVRASRAREAELLRDNLVINKATFMRTHPDSHLGHAPSIAYSELEAERDVLQQRIDKAADVLGLIHASLCMLVMDTLEQQALHDRQMEILDRVRAALTGTDNQSTEETP